MGDAGLLVGVLREVVRLVVDHPGVDGITFTGSYEVGMKIYKEFSKGIPCAPAGARGGAGALVEDVDGNLFLDFNASIAVCSTGHAHPRMAEAVRHQAGELLHYSASDFYLLIYSQYAEALAATTPMPGPVRAFLINSGTEAVEDPLKLARGPPA